LDFSWFEQRPLIGARVVVTRAREQASGLRDRLETLGAQVLELPTIAIEPLDVPAPDLSGVEWLLFTSPNGVDGFFVRGLHAHGLDTRALAGVRVGAIGPGTAQALAAFGVVADVIPERFIAESLLEALPAPIAPGARAIVARAAEARDVLPDGLRERGYDVEVLSVYRTVRPDPDPALVEQVRTGDVDLITFTSSSTVKNLTDVLGGVPDPQPTVVSIGPITSGTATELGWRLDAQAAEHTIDGVVAEVLASWAFRNGQ
jgi:uroporphyrinogen III methyltransferase/synthase